MRKTAMTELRDKLLEVIKDIRETSQTNEYLKGYREALENVAKDIDVQMLLLEKDSIVDSFAAGFGVENGISSAVIKGLEFYDATFGALSKGCS